MVSQALFPAAIGQAIDRGIIAGDTHALLSWCGVLVGLGTVGALAGTMRLGGCMTYPRASPAPW